MSYPHQKLIKGLISTTLALGAAQAAHAENKLFPTDVLTQGQVDASATLSGNSSKYDFVYKPFDAPGIDKGYTSQLAAGARYGLTPSLTIGASASAEDQRNTSVYLNSGSRYDFAASGIHGESLSAKYAFIGGDKAPMTLSGEFIARTYSNHNLAREGYDTATAELMAGWNCGQGIRSFAVASFTVPDRARHARNESLAIGSWFTLNDAATLIPSLSFDHSQASSTTPSLNAYSVGMAGLFAVSTNTYLKPAVGFGKQTGHESLSGNYHYAGVKNENASVELYHLF